MMEIPLPDGATLRKRPADHATLADLSPGQKAVVCCVRPGQVKRRRLLEMGFVSGTVLRLVRTAPLGDPVQVEVRGYQLSLRRADARGILVRPA
jgi:Fe2+ transport system protein FeoA